MSSFDISAKELRRSRFIGSVRRELKRAFSVAQKRGISQRDIAKKLGVQPSVISRQLSGSANLTLASIGDLAWALDIYPRFRLFEAAELEQPNANSVTVFKVAPPSAVNPRGASSEHTVDPGFLMAAE